MALWRSNFHRRICSEISKGASSQTKASLSRVLHLSSIRTERRLVSQMSSLATQSSETPLQQHNRQVEQIAAQIKRHYDRGEKFRISHGSTNSTRTAAKSGTLVDLSKLNRVLEVNKQTKTALVEPNVPMDRLVEATMPYGLLPPIVMDFPGITVGGGYAGTSGESSSFRHGFFDRTLNWAEIILGDSQIVRASDTDHADLFHSAAGAVGSLGTTTLVELRLVDAKPFVEVTYHPVDSIEAAISVVRASIADPSVDYVDGIMYSRSHGAIVTGKLVSAPSPNTSVRTFSRAWDPWYYLHVHSLTSDSTEPVTESVPVADYLFRYDRGGFWVGALAFRYFSPLVPFNSWTRWFLDDFLHTRMMYSALHQSGSAIPELFIQDLALPYETAPGFVEYVDRDLGIWPLWLCPLKTPASKSFHPHMRSLASTSDHATNSTEMLNIGVWGFAPKAKRGEDQYGQQIQVNRNLEAKLEELGGMKWLYAKTYHSEDQFFDIYSEPPEATGEDRGKATGSAQWYHDLRKKYNANHLPSVYDKVKTDIAAEREKQSKWTDKVKSVWPLGGIWGVWKAIQSGSYVEARKSPWKDFEKHERAKAD